MLLGNGLEVQKLPSVVGDLFIGYEVEVFGDSHDRGSFQRNEEGVWVKHVLQFTEEGVAVFPGVIKDVVADLADYEGAGVLEDVSVLSLFGPRRYQEVHIVGRIGDEVEDVDREFLEQPLRWVEHHLLVDAAELDEQLEEVVTHEQPEEVDDIGAEQAGGPEVICVG